MPLFSTIIPTFNSEKIIERSILSILGQQYKNFEIIIQDGFSTDNTLDKVHSFKKAYPEADIKVFSEKDKSVYDAMNKAVQKASGEWIYFLGSDDYLYDNQVLQKTQEFINQSQEIIHVLYGNAYSPTLGSKYDGEFNPLKLIEKNICHQAIFFNKMVFKELGLFNLKYRLFSDHEFNFRCFFNKKIKTKYIDLMIAYYEHGGISATQDDLPFRADLKLLIKNLGYKTLPLKVLKYHCTSNREFLKYFVKRVINR